MRPIPSLILLLAVSMSACAPRQFLAIPGAELVQSDAISLPTSTTQVAVVTVIAGSPALTVGQSVTMTVDYSAVTEIAVTELQIFMLELTDVWIYTLTDDERNAGSVDIEVQATDEAPSQDACEIPYHQHGYCAQDAESGVTSSVLWAENADAATSGTLLPITLDPWNDGGGGDACFSFTRDDCCAGSGGIQAVECSIDAACGCPNGTSQDIYAPPPGTHTCTC